MTAFSEELETEFKRMAFMLENVDSACWVYAIYSQAVAREEIINRLKAEIELPFFLWDYSEEKPYPIDYLRDLTEEQKQQRAIVSFFNTVDGGDKTIKSLDFNREKFAQYPHSLIFWVTENELGEMARKAGHFWAQRRGTFNFSKLIFAQIERNYSYGMDDWLNNALNIDNYQEALQQLNFYQQLLIEYPPLIKATSPINTLQLISETSDKISYLLFFLGRYSEAVDFCTKAVVLYQTLLGENNYPYTIASNNNLALLLLRCGHLTDAKTILQKLLDFLEHSEFLIATATVLNNLASVFKKQKNYNKAQSLYLKSLEIRKKVLGQEHPDIASSLNNLAGIYYAQMDYIKAEHFYKKSVAIWESSLGKEYPSIATCLNNLAMLYEDQGKYNEAIILLQRSLAIREKILGGNHAKTKQVRLNYQELLEKAARNKSNQP